MMRKLLYNLQKCSSANSLSSCIHWFLSKEVVALPTQADIVAIFERLIGGFSSVNTRLTLDSKILLPKEDRKLIYKIKKLQENILKYKKIVTKILKWMKITNMATPWQNHYALAVSKKWKASLSAQFWPHCEKYIRRGWNLLSFPYRHRIWLAKCKQKTTVFQRELHTYIWKEKVLACLWKICFSDFGHNKAKR